MATKKIIRSTFAISAAVMLLTSTSIAPANAVGTALTLTLTGGALSISAPETADLGTAAANSAGSSISTQIGEIVVTDSRAAVAGSGWIASAVALFVLATLYRASRRRLHTRRRRAKRH